MIQDEEIADGTAESIETFSSTVEVADTSGLVQEAHVYLGKKLVSMGVSEGNTSWLKALIFFGITLILSWFLWWVTRKILLTLINRLSDRTTAVWDDIMVKHHVFARFAHLVPAFFFGYATLFTFKDYSDWIPTIYHLINLLVILIVMRGMAALINSFAEILQQKPGLRDKPMGSYAQLAKLILYLICGVLMISVLFNKSPLYFFSAMGAMTAVLLLIFKDTLLGFVASIQIAANDMVRVGDWVTMDKYGADGDVMEINLTTVKVRNFDNTITTIPTYAFIADSFRNWRGMQESDGRRIKRAIKINIASIKFCTPEMIERYKKFQVVREYVKERQDEIESWNSEHHIDKNELLNGRHMTNLGVFRAYLTSYLKGNPHINQDMTLMVRQLEPTETGIPIEVYVFSKDKNWVAYEHIISDIFDHVLAAVPGFDLSIFQSPSGADFQELIKR